MSCFCHFGNPSAFGGKGFGGGVSGEGKKGSARAVFSLSLSELPGLRNGKPGESQAGPWLPRDRAPDGAWAAQGRSVAAGVRAGPGAGLGHRLWPWPAWCTCGEPPVHGLHFRGQGDWKGRSQGRCGEKAPGTWPLRRGERGAGRPVRPRETWEGSALSKCSHPLRPSSGNRNPQQEGSPNFQRPEPSWFDPS